MPTSKVRNLTDSTLRRTMTRATPFLMKAAEVIFSPATTGYLAKEPDAQGSLQVMEIFKGIGGKSGN